jgi:hypothetical protein
LLDADVLTNPWSWLLDTLDRALFNGRPEDVAPKLIRVFFDAGNQSNPFRLENYCGPCHALWAGLMPVGTICLAVALLARVGLVALRTREQSAPAMHTLVDVGFRGLAGSGALQLSFPVLSWLSSESMILAGQLVAFLVGRLYTHTGAAAEAVALLVPVNLLAAPVSALLFMLLLGYITVMVVLSRAAIILAVLAAPFAVPALAFAEEGRLAVTWLRMVFFACAVPPAAALCLGGAIVLLRVGMDLSTVIPFGPPVLASAASLWATVMVINGLMRETARGGGQTIAGTLRSAGLGPVAGELERRGHRAQGHLQRAGGALAAGARMAGLGLRGGSFQPPGRGLHEAFDAFCADHMAKLGMSKVGGTDLSPMKQQAMRVYLWAKYLARPLA